VNPRTAYAGGQEHEHEPVPGLPAELPADERMLWQGSPSFTSLALRAFHVRKVALYFLALMLWRGASALADGDTARLAAAHALWLLPMALIAVGLLSAMAWHASRGTLYTLTTRRIVMRFGLALPMSVNIPFRIVETAGLRCWRDGSGDLTLRIGGSDRIAYLHLWPHARPWKLARPEPMLRGVAEPQAVAALLADALAGTPDLKAMAPAAPPATSEGSTTPPFAHA
jgi:Bacterial PH domain